MTIDQLRANVATACRLIAMEGFTDLTLGHVSARLPGARTIWIKRKGLALDEVEPEDVIALDLDDPDAFPPQYHVWTASRRPWVHLADGLPDHADRGPDVG